MKTLNIHYSAPASSNCEFVRRWESHRHSMDKCRYVYVMNGTFRGFPLKRNVYILEDLRFMDKRCIPHGHTCYMKSIHYKRNRARQQFSVACLKIVRTSLELYLTRVHALTVFSVFEPCRLLDWIVLNPRRMRSPKGLITK